MNAALCLVAGSIGICQNPEAKWRTEKMVAFAAPIASNTYSRRGNGKYTGFVILLSFCNQQQNGMYHTAYVLILLEKTMRK